ncbi:hypothetical protein CO180_01510 [candidate division WWE3 bacterium CG_4_9_14_3_um_filter_41_6]|uniref:Uncharacterized protein n=1 Tax=candidate division WWE3 bacterium CG_4_10_14_0_2_um_filter_41_14 TaxID=1975072 RepID=A0A2M7TI35_UNCKA|nr:MAG: hypothetical protein COY32_05015 [candidate division WWE3 bacterium CG_4_10_14_0_2_um_filter_41_14]PJA39135.1 MAG: hypothetical protein CO180_01510 [candidate division WWE3 bacterium CG_4_9_14_3_um_filter_41_6]
MTTKTTNNQTLSEILDELKQLDEWFQGESFEIEKSIEQYKKGMEKIQQARLMLDDVENEFSQVATDVSGSEEQGDNTSDD